jgi:hypothetical protein
MIMNDEFELFWKKLLGRNLPGRTDGSIAGVLTGIRIEQFIIFFYS